MSKFAPAENLSETMTVGQLVEALSDLDPNALVVLRICMTQIVAEDEPRQAGDHTLAGPAGAVTVRMGDPLDCAIEAEDIEPNDGVVYLCTGHEALENYLN